MLEVNISALGVAAGKLPKMKRGPNGAKGKIPKDTWLTPMNAGLLVDTPAVQTVVPGRGASFGRQVSVDAEEFARICKHLAELWAAHSDATVSISVDTSHLVLKVGQSTVRIKLIAAQQ